jgi:hypothetical protein
VGLQFLPPRFSDPAGSCNGSGYDTPKVPVALLPGNAGAIESAMGSSPTGLSTPTEGALRGATSFCVAYESAHPAEGCTVAFITDGMPSSCDQTPADLVKIVADAYAAGVRTFAIGLSGVNPGDVDMAFLNAVAVAGGTQAAYADPREGLEAARAAVLAGCP